MAHENCNKNLLTLTEYEHTYLVIPENLFKRSPRLGNDYILNFLDLYVVKQLKHTRFLCFYCYTNKIVDVKYTNDYSAEDLICWFEYFPPGRPVFSEDIFLRWTHRVRDSGIYWRIAMQLQLPSTRFSLAPEREPGPFLLLSFFFISGHETDGPPLRSTNFVRGALKKT